MRVVVVNNYYTFPLFSHHFCGHLSPMVQQYHLSYLHLHVNINNLLHANNTGIRIFQALRRPRLFAPRILRTFSPKQKPETIQYTQDHFLQVENPNSITDHISSYVVVEYRFKNHRMVLNSTSPNMISTPASN